MRGRLKELNLEMFKILMDPRASRVERLESGRIIAALHGVFVTSGLGESTLSTKAAVQLRAAQKEIAERLFKKTRQKKAQNARAYLRRQIRQLERQQERKENGTITTTATGN